MGSALRRPPWIELRSYQKVCEKPAGFPIHSPAAVRDQLDLFLLPGSLSGATYA